MRNDGGKEGKTGIGQSTRKRKKEEGHRRNVQPVTLPPLLAESPPSPTVCRGVELTVQTATGHTHRHTHATQWKKHKTITKENEKDEAVPPPVRGGR